MVATYTYFPHLCFCLSTSLLLMVVIIMHFHCLMVSWVFGSTPTICIRGWLWTVRPLQCACYCLWIITKYYEYIPWSRNCNNHLMTTRMIWTSIRMLITSCVILFTFENLIATVRLHSSTLLHLHIINVQDLSLPLYMKLPLNLYW